jgi:hypothetical protein
VALNTLTKSSAVEGNLGFVQVVCSYSVAIAGLAHKLEKVEVRCRPEPPLGSTPGCTRPYVQDVGEISEAIRRVCEAST